VISGTSGGSIIAGLLALLSEKDLMEKALVKEVRPRTSACACADAGIEPPVTDTLLTQQPADAWDWIIPTVAPAPPITFIP
jgi:predicted acylesterase/phospholipase RssA